jgi:GntR family transcriptional regulator
MKIDPHSNTPVFEQIADSMRSGVVAGLYLPGEPIPSIRALAVKLLINPNTITRAYEQLERDGIIESRKGLGMFVTSAAPEIARAATERSVQATFTQGILLGRAAQISKTRIDEVYRKSWPDGSKR